MICPQCKQEAGSVQTCVCGYVFDVETAGSSDTLSQTRNAAGMALGTSAAPIDDAEKEARIATGWAVQFKPDNMNTKVQLYWLYIAILLLTFWGKGAIILEWGWEGRLIVLASLVVCILFVLDFRRVSRRGLFLYESGMVYRGCYNFEKNWVLHYTNIDKVVDGNRGIEVFLKNGTSKLAFIQNRRDPAAFINFIISKM